MAPKREIQFLGSTQPAGDCWRAEVFSVGKGPSRPTRTEAQGDLDIARQANSRQDMGALLRQMTTGSLAAQSLTGQPIEPEPVLLPQQHSHAPSASGDSLSEAKKAKIDNSDGSFEMSRQNLENVGVHATPAVPGSARKPEFARDLEDKVATLDPTQHQAYLFVSD